MCACYSGGYSERGLKCGFGKTIYKNGDQYEGDYVDGKRDGYGRYCFAKGGTYVGEWKCGKKHGKGKFTYKDGTSYEGDFCDDLRTGRGKYCYSNGDVYDGYWHKQKRNGFGTYFYVASRVKFEGLWCDGFRTRDGAIKSLTRKEAQVASRRARAFGSESGGCLIGQENPVDCPPSETELQGVCGVEIEENKCEVLRINPLELDPSCPPSEGVCEEDNLKDEEGGTDGKVSKTEITDETERHESLTEEIAEEENGGEYGEGKYEGNEDEGEDNDDEDTDGKKDETGDENRSGERAGDEDDHDKNKKSDEGKEKERKGGKDKDDDKGKETETETETDKEKDKDKNKNKDKEGEGGREGEEEEEEEEEKFDSSLVSQIKNKGPHAQITVSSAKGEVQYSKITSLIYPPEEGSKTSTNILINPPETLTKASIREGSNLSPNPDNPSVFVYKEPTKIDQDDFNKLSVIQPYDTNYVNTPLDEVPPGHTEILITSQSAKNGEISKISTILFPSDPENPTHAQIRVSPPYGNTFSERPGTTYANKIDAPPLPKSFLSAGQKGKNPQVTKEDLKEVAKKLSFDGEQ